VKKTYLINDLFGSPLRSWFARGLKLGFGSFHSPTGRVHAFSFGFALGDSRHRGSRPRFLHKWERDKPDSVIWRTFIGESSSSPWGS